MRKAGQLLQRELLQLAVYNLHRAGSLPPRLTELGGHSVPAMFLYQLLHLREDCFGERARVVLPIPPHLDVNEDAEDVLPEAPAVDMPLDVPDPVHRLWPRVVVGLLDAEDYVGVVLLAVLHLAEDDVPYANLGGLLLERVDSILRCGLHQAGSPPRPRGPTGGPRAPCAAMVGMAGV